MMEQNRQIELRSEKVRNIIGQIPPVLLRYGIMVISIAVLFLIIISTFIPYQPSIPTQVTIRQDSSGNISYTALIPSHISNPENLNFEINDYKNILPSIFKAKLVSDTIYLIHNESYKKVHLQPLESTKERRIKIKNTIILSGKIVFPTITIFRYVTS